MDVSRHVKSRKEKETQKLVHTHTHTHTHKQQPRGVFLPIQFLIDLNLFYGLQVLGRGGQGVGGQGRAVGVKDEEGRWEQAGGGGESDRGAAKYMIVRCGCGVQRFQTNQDSGRV